MAIPILYNKETTYNARDFQSVFDVAVQLYGDISRIDEILPIIRNLGTKIAFGTHITYTPTKDPVSLFFQNKVVATSFYTVESVDGAILLESGDFMLLESGDYILLE